MQDQALQIFETLTTGTIGCILTQDCILSFASEWHKVYVKPSIMEGCEVQR